MGKSPGKWIKTILFGKKSSKSSLSKASISEKKTCIPSKAPLEELAVNNSVISDPPCQITDGTEQNALCGAGASIELPCDTTPLPAKHGVDIQRTTELNICNATEASKLEQAAIKAQAAFRGYLARRAFRALKGIIRLQALVRGHLVRRQAVATLHCMQAIVKFQAVVRGRRVRLSDSTQRCIYGGPKGAKAMDLLGADFYVRSDKLSANIFVGKLLVALPNTMALSLHYDPVEPNSAWNWLERWSSARFWEPLVRPKKIVETKPQRKQANMLIAETESSKMRKSGRKVPSINGDSNSLHSSEIDKSKRTRKLLAHQTEHVQEQPQNELERVKRNLRKVSASAAMALDKSEIAPAKTEPTERKVSVAVTLTLDNDITTTKTEQVEKKLPSLQNPDACIDDNVEKMNEPVIVVPKISNVETLAKALDEPIDMLPDDHPMEELHLEEFGEVENSLSVNEASRFGEDQISKENERTRRRRSFPAKQEFPENVSQNSPAVPSYMAATESAKAKLRAQGSPRIGEDGSENNLRRHSLPSPANGKMHTPRVQRQVQTNGKSGSKTNRSLSSSRDEKLIQPGWRR